MRPTQRAADMWDFARFTSILLRVASSRFASCSQAESSARLTNRWANMKELNG